MALRKSFWAQLGFWLLAALTPSLQPVFAQEHPREHDSRRGDEEKRKKEQTEGDRLGKDDGKLDKDSDRMKKEGLGKEEDRSLAKESGDGRREDGKQAQNRERSERGFRSEGDLQDHYDKHVTEQREFGNISREEYLRQAKELRDRPADGKETLEIRRGDDRISKYDRNTNSFGAYERDGTVVTYFKPTDGERYFRSQAEARK